MLQLQQSDGGGVEDDTQSERIINKALGRGAGEGGETGAGEDCQLMDFPVREPEDFLVQSCTFCSSVSVKGGLES